MCVMLRLYNVKPGLNLAIFNHDQLRCEMQFSRLNSLRVSLSIINYLPVVAKYDMQIAKCHPEAFPLSELQLDNHDDI